jgi:Zinc finger, C2H2 type
MKMTKEDFTCLSCDSSFKTKYSLNRHYSDYCQKKINETIKNISNSIILYDDNIIKCEYCDKIFPKQYRLERHLKSNKGKCYNERNKKNKNSMSHNINYKKQINYNNCNIINNHTTINNNVNVQNIIKPQIIIAKHGEETISHITKDVMLELLNIESFPKMCTELMRLLYFNKEVPENRNWTIVYPKNKNAGVEYNHETLRFERKKTYDIIDDKFSNMLSLLFDLVQEISNEDLLNNNLSKRQKININKYGMHFGQLEISKTSKEVYESIHSLAFNSRKEQMKEWGESGHKGNHLSLKF